MPPGFQTAGAKLATSAGLRVFCRCAIVNRLELASQCLLADITTLSDFALLRNTR
jgi:hypothetical protein